MTPTLQEWAQQLLPVVQAAAAGQPIEHFNGTVWLNKTMPGFLVTMDYRVAAQTRIINGFTVPAAVQYPLEKGTDYYSPDLRAAYFRSGHTWHGNQADLDRAHRNLVFLTAEAAVANAKAMCGIDPAAEE